MRGGWHEGANMGVKPFGCGANMGVRRLVVLRFTLSISWQHSQGAWS